MASILYGSWESIIALLLILSINRAATIILNETSKLYCHVSSHHIVFDYFLIAIIRTVLKNRGEFIHTIINLTDSECLAWLKKPYLA